MPVDETTPLGAVGLCCPAELYIHWTAIRTDQLAAARECSFHGHLLVEMHQLSDQTRSRFRSGSEHAAAGWFCLDRGAAVVAVVLTVLAAMGSYLSDQPIGFSEQAFLLAAFYLMAHGLRLALRRVRSAKVGRS